MARPGIRSNLGPRLLLLLLAALAATGQTASAAAGLAASDLLLIVNKNNADSVALAKFYAQQRKVPDGRLLQLDVPFAEKCSHAEYEEKIAAPVRQFLASPAGKDVRCLVLFYGVPFQVGASESTPQDREEVAMLRRLLTELDTRVPASADAMEAIAKDLQLTLPKDAKAEGVVGASRRIDAAVTAIQQHLQTQPRDKQQAIIARLTAVQKEMIGIGLPALEAVQKSSATNPATTKPTAATPADTGAPDKQTRADRERFREQIARRNGPFALYKVAEEQVKQLSGQNSDASVDSELSLVRRPGYVRFHWQPNPLRDQLDVGPSTALMVSRIDASTPEIAKRIISDAVGTEQSGLSGRAVFDSRGIPPKKDGYAPFDEDIRNTAAFVKAKTKLQVVHDDRAALINPHAAKDVSVYCGWYSVRQYVPSCDFVRGAVAYHVASWEMISLRTPDEKGWVANLLRDNVCATLGAVSEPYLGAFPLPSEFVPLLLSGRLSLAEVYWATIPSTSWKMCLVGDPLYRPFAAKPAVAVADLPEAQRKLVEKFDSPTPSGR